MGIKMVDYREALIAGNLIKCSNNKLIEIVEEVGRGAGCIVYNAVYCDNINVKHNIRIKECYPSYLQIERDNLGGLITSSDKQEKFNFAKNYFINAYKKNTAIRNTLGLVNSTVNVSQIVNYNNTIYTVINLDEGIDYRRYKDKTLKDLFVHIRSVAEVIEKYHKNGYLHLDIKPENIFILPETNEHILLFDFDTVTSIEELQQGNNFSLSYSEGFSAPEQVQGKVGKIGRHTDIFSVGAMVFYKLFNEKPISKNCKISSVFDFNKMLYKSENYSPQLYITIENFFRKTMSISILQRWQEMEPVIKELNKLIKLSDIEEVYLINNFQYNSGCFVGRNEEIKKIDNILCNNQVVFLWGIGGIGKTELAKKYADVYGKKYNTITFAVFENNLKDLVCDEILINKINKDDNETNEEYFNRKIEILKKVATPNDLIIIDNFDVEFDEDLEVILECPCKFIFTSRIDYRDYNYKQLTIDKIESIEEICNLFCTYNDIDYDENEMQMVENLINYVDFHTMTVELMAKYLRNTGESPEQLYNKFLEKEGIVNTKDISIKQRKDHKLRFESVNNHLSTLFDISGFNSNQKEILASLSLFAGIRIRKLKFIDLCQVKDIENKLNLLIKDGWIEYNNVSEKISLHQVLQDLIYKNLCPNAVNCPGIVKGMEEYITTDLNAFSYRKIKRKVFEIFMDRLSGDNISYARLCLAYGKEDKLNEAEKICLASDQPNAYDLLQRIYRKKMKITMECKDIFDTEMEFEDYVIFTYKQIAKLLDNAILFCNKCSTEPEYIVREYINIGVELDDLLGGNVWMYQDTQTPELDILYREIIKLYDKATELLPLTSYSNMEKVEMYKKIQSFYSDKETFMLYRNNYFSDVKKAYWYQKIIDELRDDIKTESADVIVTEGEAEDYIYYDDVTTSEMAHIYMEEGNYEKAIEYYQKSYEEGSEDFYCTMDYISAAYVKLGDYNKAINILENVIDEDKEKENKEKENKKKENKEKRENKSKIEKFFRYPYSTCIDLMKILFTQNEYKKVCVYAKELIDYIEKDALLEESHYLINFALGSYYYLYILEDEENRKNALWQKCLEYYKLLKDNVIDECSYEFAIEYLDKECNVDEECNIDKECIIDEACNVDEECNIEEECTTYQEILNIIERIDENKGIEIKKRIINQSIKKYFGKEKFHKYYVLLLLKLSEIYNQYPYSQIKSGEKYCEQAKEYYFQNNINDEYILSLIYETKVKLMINDKDYEDNKAYKAYEGDKVYKDNKDDMIKEIKMKCNFEILAEHRLENKNYDEEERMDIWMDAASEYGSISNREKEVACLLKALALADPIINKNDFSFFEHTYWQILDNLFYAYVNLNEYQKAKSTMFKLYEVTIKYQTNNQLQTKLEADLQTNLQANLQTELQADLQAELQLDLQAELHSQVETKDLDDDINSFDLYSKCLRISQIADHLVELDMIEESINIYLIAMFFALEEQPKLQAVNEFCKDDVSLCESICKLLDNKIEEDIVDSVIEIKDKLVEYKDYYSCNEMYDRIINKISENFQHQDIEFK